MPISGLLTFWKGRERMVLNTVIALTTIFSQQAFSFFTFKCPCKTTLNLYYALSFIAVPALVLLILGYAINNMTWKLIMSFGYGTQLKLNSCKLICFVLLSVTGRAVIAPVTWVAVTLLNGLYYQCGMSEFLSVSSWNVFQNLTLRERKDILARFPCPKVSIKKIHNISEIRNEANRILLYQSQVAGWILIASVTIIAFLSICIPRYCSPLSFVHLNYWAQYLESESSLFRETAKRHSQLYASKHIKKFFGFTAQENEVKKIRLPTRKDWRMISGINAFTKLEQDPCQYSLLHTWADETTAGGDYIPVDNVVSEAYILD
ncbi:calcium homeostasis modulator protein 4-like isoform X3 [Stegostoma tigrinum]|uniref:calcium homeostasis modulator protein 4-like isoform X3 n=1 Tax=Stegostoma tigrinum TaxID=3053191 RepID=UPI00202B0A46|nr:calcium homeostasis modulator protein 4-like isoform X3 [Stegostoma tigrinum]